MIYPVIIGGVAAAVFCFVASNYFDGTFKFLTRLAGILLLIYVIYYICDSVNVSAPW